MTKIVYHPPKSLIRLVTHFKRIHNSWEKTCRKISNKLNYKWGTEHIYNIYKGRSPATDEFKYRVNQLAYKTFNPTRHWLNIHALTLEQKERWKLIPMAKRREALDRAFTDMNYQTIRKGIINARKNKI